MRQSDHPFRGGSATFITTYVTIFANLAFERIAEIPSIGRASIGMTAPPSYKSWPDGAPSPSAEGAKRQRIAKP